MHKTVLKNKIIELLNVKPKGKYIDATAGEGNLVEEILKRKGVVLAIDWDEKQIKKIKKKFINEKNLIFWKDNFANLENIAKKFHFIDVDGIIFDLGISYDQLENSSRGFSYKKFEEKLDMRINLQSIRKASDILNKESRTNLIKIFSTYGEEINTEKIANKIIEYRKNKSINKVGQLIEIIDSGLEKKDKKVYRRIFQALRISVNNELENLKKGLQQALKLIKSDGRIVVASFHSLESRIVKKFIRENHLVLLTNKVIKGERSSQLRVFSLPN